MHFGVQKPFEIWSRFGDAFFRLAPTSRGLRGGFKGTSKGLRRGYFFPRFPQGGALFACGGIPERALRAREVV